MNKESEPWFPWCLRCLQKHILLAEGHAGEAIDRCAREHRKETTLLIKDGDESTYPKSEWLRKMETYANILNDLGEIRKRLEGIYYTEEILVAKT